MTRHDAEQGRGWPGQEQDWRCATTSPPQRGPRGILPQPAAAGPGRASLGSRTVCAGQGELFPPEDVEAVEGECIEERFARFHGKNPQVYRALRGLALKAVRHGRRRGSMKQLFERLRLDAVFQTEGEEWKLNNSYTALYARLLMAREPELEGWFETRRRKGDEGVRS